MGYEEEEVSGRCAAILANGKRCPNAAIPGSRYCGLPAHQALVDQEGDELEAGAAGVDGDAPAVEPVEAAGHAADPDLPAEAPELAPEAGAAPQEPAPHPPEEET